MGFESSSSSEFEVVTRNLAIGAWRTTSDNTHATVSLYGLRLRRWEMLLLRIHESADLARTTAGRHRLRAQSGSAGRSPLSTRRVVSWDHSALETWSTSGSWMGHARMTMTCCREYRERSRASECQRPRHVRGASAYPEAIVKTRAATLVLGSSGRRCALAWRPTSTRRFARCRLLARLIPHLNENHASDFYFHS